MTEPSKDQKLKSISFKFRGAYVHEKTCGRGSAVAEGIRKRTIILLSQHIWLSPKKMLLLGESKEVWENGVGNILWSFAKCWSKLTRIVLAEKTGWWGCYDYTAGHTGVFVEWWSQIRLIEESKKKAVKM